jgi:hypothetical protein
MCMLRLEQESLPDLIACATPRDAEGTVWIHGKVDRALGNQPIRSPHSRRASRLYSHLSPREDFAG